MTIQGRKVRLRAIERSDIPAFVRWFNDPEITQYIKMFMPMSLAQEERWFGAHLDLADSHILGIETPDGRLIGNLGLHDINWKDRKAVLGIVIGEKDCWGQGYGTDAIKTMLSFAFAQMNLHRISLTVFEYNARALRCYEKCGFKAEGRLRRAHFHDGRYYDELIMGVLSDEFQSSIGPES